jgi:hypothetical protein
MKTSNKNMIATITLILLMTSITLTTITVNTTKAQTFDQPVSGELPTGVTPSLTINAKAYLSFRPNPVGVNQPVLVNVWTTPATSWQRFHQGYVVTITKPDGTKETIQLESYKGDATAWFEFTPEKAGNYTLKFEFLGEYYPAGYYLDGYVVSKPPGTEYIDSAYYSPASTPEQTLTVQEEMVASWPASALPTDYWTRPISPENREWWVIAGNYPGNGIVGGGPDWPADTNTYVQSIAYGQSASFGFTPYVQAPNTAHIVWKKQGALSGLIGGITGQFSTTTAPGTPSVIYAGRAYQTMTVPVNGVPTSCAVCYDIRTGEQYYAIPISQGGVTPNVISYAPGTGTTGEGGTSGFANPTSQYTPTLMSIGTGRLIKIDPYSGAVTLNVTGIANGGYYSSTPIGPTGFATALNGLYRDPYALTTQILGTGANIHYYLINWTTAGTESNFTKRIVSNITWPFGPQATTNGMSYNPEFILADPEANVAVYLTSIFPLGMGASEGTLLTAADMTTGTMLWNITSAETMYNGRCAVADHGKIALLMQNKGYMCFDIYSGKLLWTSEAMDYPWGEPGFGAYAVQSAYGLIFHEAYDGVYAFDWDTGKIAWKYEDIANPFETPYTNAEGETVNSFNGIAMIADGKLYTYNNEHSPSEPITRGWKLHCINATSGEGIWNISGYLAPGAMADGYLTAANSYDGYMYVFGKGKSATTVTAPDVIIKKGEGIVIRGTVLDQSPAQAGTACVSKETMKTQMEYLHMQKPIGGLWGNETITGVPVTLTAIDPNGNYVNIGTVTTDGYYGTYSMPWTPEIEGNYQIIASFAGDDSYGSSAASVGISVSEAAATPTPSQQQIVIPDYTLTIIGGIIAVIIAVALVGIILYRKK